MIRGEPWQRAEVPGPIKAFLVSEPKKLAILMRASKRPLIVVGNRVSKFEEGGKNLVNYLVELAQLINAHIVVTGRLIRRFREKGYKDIYLMPAMELLDRLSDPSWRGFDDKGKYDLAIFIGFHYYYEWLMLSGLKHFAYKWLKTMTLDPYFQPNATWSPPNMRLNEWYKFLEELVNNLR